MALPSLECYTHEVTWSAGFCVWLLSLDIRGPIHAVACNAPFLLLLSVVSMRGGWTTVCFSVSPFVEVWAFPSDYDTGANKYSLTGLWASL